MIAGVLLPEKIKAYFEARNRLKEEGHEPETRRMVVEEGRRLQKALEAEGERIERELRRLHPQLRLSRRENIEEPPEAFFLRLSRDPYTPDEDAQMYMIWSETSLEIGFGFGWPWRERFRGHLEARFRGQIQRFHRKASRYLRDLLRGDYRLWTAPYQPPSHPSLGSEDWMKEGSVVARSIASDGLIAAQADAYALIHQSWEEMIGLYGFLDRIYTQIPPIRSISFGAEIDESAPPSGEEGGEAHSLASNFSRWARRFGLFYPLESAEIYLLSLQTAPFVILAGATGTGKSKIAQMVGRFLLEDAEQDGRNPHVEVIPVRPDWLDPHALLGYYDTLAEVYRATPFLRLLLRAASDPMEPYFAILDEMNLAPVEYYLADFLSLLETRRYDRKGHLLDCAPLALHDQPTPLLIDDPCRGLLSLPSSLPLPPNLWLIGTVNLDETTKRLSPKVLDRALFLELASPSPSAVIASFFENEEASIPRDLMAIRKQREILIGGGRFCGPFGATEYLLPPEEIKAWGHDLDLLAALFQKAGLGLGLRIVAEGLRFAEVAWRWFSPEAWEPSWVFDQWLGMKILPRLSGAGEAIGRLVTDLLFFCFSQTPKERESLLGKERLLTSEEIERALRRGRGDTEEAFEAPALPLSAKKLAALLSAWKQDGFVDFQRTL